MLNLVERFDRWRTRHYFANDIDENYNAQALKVFTDARAAYRGPALNRALRRNYERTMYSRLPGVAFDPATFKAVQTKGQAALSDTALAPCQTFAEQRANGKPLPPGRLTHEVRRNVTDLAKAVPEAGALLDDKVCHAIRSCLGSNFTLQAIYLNRTFHVEPDLIRDFELLAERWHFDHQMPHICSLFVYLSDVTEDDGPFHCIGSSGTRQVLKAGFDPASREQSPTGGLKETDLQSAPGFLRFTGPAGSMLLCHTSYCLHRSHSPAPGHTRDMMTFLLHPSEAMDLAWPKP